MFGIRHNMMGSVRGPATCVGATTKDNPFGTAMTVNLPVGSKVGDVCILISDNDVTYGAGTSVTSSSGWASTPVSWGLESTVHIKALDSTDIAAGAVTISGVTSGSFAVLGVWNGVAAGAIKSTVSGVWGSTIALTGFTKSAYCRGIVAIVIDSETDSTVTPPGGWTERVEGTGATYGFKGNISDLLTPAGYTNGASVTYTVMQGGSNNGQHGYLIELT